MAKQEKIDERKISEMRNLGPACEQDLNAAGIYTAEELKTLGPEGAFLKMLDGRVRQGRSAKCCNAAYFIDCDLNTSPFFKILFSSCRQQVHFNM